jgi:hypothetical protein
MSKTTYIVLGLFISVIAGFAVLSPQPVSAKGSCEVREVLPNKWGSSFSTNGSNITATFEVIGKDCTAPVTVAVWKRMTVEGINDQVLYKYKTGYFAPGHHTMTTQIPNCMYQADVLASTNPRAADGTANYMYQNGKFVDGGLKDFIKGGNGSCVVTPKPPTKPPVETPPVVETPVVEAPVVETPVETTPIVEEVVAAPAPTPAPTIPKTGATASAVLGLSTTAGTFGYLRKSRRNLLKTLLNK